MLKSISKFKDKENEQTKQANRVGVNSEKVVDNFDVKAPLPNKGSQSRIDISEQVNPKSHLITPKNTNSLPMTKDLLIGQSYFYKFADERKQLVIFNNTGRTIKICINKICNNTNDYDLIVNANKMCVFPPFNFDSIGIFQDTFTDTTINPTMFTYSDANLAPSISNI